MDTIQVSFGTSLKRANLKASLLSEFERFLDVEGDRPLKYFLWTAGAYETLRTQLSTQAAPLIAEFAQSGAFKNWTKD